MGEANDVPHVLIFPFPAQGHVPPMLKLAELMNSNTDIYVTFVNTENIHARFLQRSSSAFGRLSEQRMFRFCTIPDGLPDDDPRPFDQFLKLEESLGTRSREPYRQLLSASCGKDSDGWPPVSCVIADGILPLASEVPEEMGIPVMVLRTSSACSVWIYCSILELIENGELPFPEAGDMDELVKGVKGMESFLRRRDLPAGILRDADGLSLPYLIKISNSIPRAGAFILNTVEHLEATTLSLIRSINPVTYTIGPLQLLHKTIKSVDNSNSRGIVSLWQEDCSCMTWLDGQANKSVVYVSFGSITVISRDEFWELWHGLINSGHNFLWVIRPDMVQGGINAEDVLADKGCLVDWAPQEDVLAHPAVGCFLTHSGWNSTLESVVAGVPMICWPFFGDQQINSRYVSKVWEIGVDMKDTCGRSTVEEMVRKVMNGEEADMLQKKAEAMAEVVKMSAKKGGSSYVNFHKLIDHIKSLASQSTNQRI